MSRLFRGSGLGIMIPVIQCDYQRCSKFEQLPQPEPYPQAELRSNDLEAGSIRWAALAAAPQPKGWFRLTWRSTASIVDLEVKDLCSWHHLKNYATRSERDGR